MEDWPFVGRGTELAYLRELIGSEACSGVVVAGAAGVGKSRIASEFLRWATEAGWGTARVTATRSAATQSFGAFASLLRSVGREEAGTVGDRAGLLRRCAIDLTERAGGRRPVLVVDNAHLLDDASATLVHQLCEGRRAFVVATVCTGEPSPDPVVALWKDRLAERLDVKGLTFDSLEQLLASVLSGPLDGAAARELAMRSQGNVLFLRELVLGALEDGTLRDQGGIWRLIAPLAPSERLVELVEARLIGLLPAERALVELVSYGEPLGRAELEALGDPDLADRLERAHILSSRVDGRRLEVRLAHTVYGDVLRARTPAVAVANITRALAEVAEANGGRRQEDSLRIATWRLTGGGGSPELLVAGAETARWHYDFALAERLARAALEAGGGFDAALLAAQVASLQGCGDSAEAELADLLPRASTDAERCIIAHARIDNCFSMGRPDKARKIAEDSEPTILDPVWRDEIVARRSWLDLTIDGPLAGAKTAEPLLQQAHGRALVWACASASYASRRIGRLGEALEVARLGQTVYRSLIVPLEWYPGLFPLLRCEVLMHMGQLREAEELARAEHKQSLSEHSPSAQALFAMQLSVVLRERGQIGTAARHGQEAAALFAELGRPSIEWHCLCFLAWALALAGRAGEARDALSRLDALALPPAFSPVDLSQARAWAAAATGNLSHAQRLLSDAATVGRDVGDFVGAAGALHDMARLGAAEDAAGPLAELAVQIEGSLTPARAAHVQALACGDPAGLERSSLTFEGIGADLLAAEAAADAAVMLRQQGEPRLAAPMERRAALLADRCEQAVTPSLQRIEARARLTAAERQAALLAANGRSNKQIAGELSVSLRTVENHLHRVYAKLGIASREELAAALGATRSGDSREG